MQYRIECIQTVFGEERERRLKLAFDIIWNLDVKKTVAKCECSESHTATTKVITMADEAEHESNSDGDASLYKLKSNA